MSHIWFRDNYLCCIMDGINKVILFFRRRENVLKNKQLITKTATLCSQIHYSLEVNWFENPKWKFMHVKVSTISQYMTIFPWRFIRWLIQTNTLQTVRTRRQLKMIHVLSHLNITPRGHRQMAGHQYVEGGYLTHCRGVIYIFDASCFNGPRKIQIMIKFE